MGRRARYIEPVFAGLFVVCLNVSQTGAQEAAQVSARNDDPAPIVAAPLVIYDPNALVAAEAELPRVHGPRRFEFDLTAGRRDASVEVSLRHIAPTDLQHTDNETSTELRLGRTLRNRDQGSSSSVYLFVASDNEALTWRPGAGSESGGLVDDFKLREQVEIGDVSAGLSYERNGVQASLAYVERAEETTVGIESFSQDTSFVGITITRR